MSASYVSNYSKSTTVLWDLLLLEGVKWFYMPCQSSVYCQSHSCRQGSLVFTLLCEKEPHPAATSAFIHTVIFILMCLSHKLRRQIKLCASLCLCVCLSSMRQAKQGCWHPWNVFLARLHSSQSSANSALEERNSGSEKNLCWPIWPWLRASPTERGET